PLMNEDYIDGLPQSVYENLQLQNEFIIETICKRIDEIGTISPSDAHRLTAAYYAGADMDKINKEIARITNKNLAEIERIYRQVGEDNAAFGKALYEFKNMPFIPFESNGAIQSMVYAMSKITKGEYINLSRTAGFVSRDGKPLTIRQQYIKAIDRALTAVATGNADYHSEMRRIIKEMAASGYSRRMDSSVRQNILTGIKDISQEMQNDIGQAVGADGYEISYHSNPRPTHADMGGRQYSREEFYRQGIDILLQDYNCYHIAFNIIMGISSPNHGKAELAKLKAKDTKTYEWHNRQITGYQATQIQRKYETEIRRLKEEQAALKAAGDTVGRHIVQSKINSVSGEYTRFSSSVNLSVKHDRKSIIK
ncbi:MAG: phage minor capsid protein, partial [Oscillospiraceae bacterium]